MVHAWPTERDPLRGKIGAIAALTVLVGLAVFWWPSDADALDNGVAFGAYASPVDGRTNITAIERLEQQLGTTLPVVRTFHKWDDDLGADKPLHRWIKDGDRQVMASVKAVRENGEVLRWRDIADARPGSRLHDDMIAMAQGAKRHGDTMILGFHHEPEHRNNQQHGDNADFKAAFRKLHDVFETEGVRNVRFAWIMTSWSFEVGDNSPNDRRVADRWYPGDDVVDYISVQEYNWANCRDSNDGWESLEDGLEPFMRFARKHPSKKLVLAEWGAAEGQNGQKAEWLDDARTLFKTGEYRDRFAALLYFHDDGREEGLRGCDWWLDSSSSSLAAARRLAQDSFYQADLGGSPPPAPPTPTTTAPTTTAPTATTAPTTTAPTATTPPTTPTTPASTTTTTTKAPTVTSVVPPKPPTRPADPLPDTVRCFGRIATIVGTSGSDTLTGTSGADVIHGLGGNDTISGLRGDDVICGGDGDDKITGGGGADLLFGGGGRDLLRGGYGPDVIHGGLGPDRINGQHGNDQLFGNEGNDIVRGGPHQDIVRGGANADKILGQGGFDVLTGGPGDDTINGGVGADNIGGGAGNDRCSGGPGRDTVRCERR